MHFKETTITDTSSGEFIHRSLLKLDTAYNTTINKVHKPITEEKIKVNGDTRVILILEHK